MHSECTECGLQSLSYSAAEAVGPPCGNAVLKRCSTQKLNSNQKSNSKPQPSGTVLDWTAEGGCPYTVRRFPARLHCHSGPCFRKGLLPRFVRAKPQMF